MKIVAVGPDISYPTIFSYVVDEHGSVHGECLVRKDFQVDLELPDNTKVCMSTNGHVRLIPNDQIQMWKILESKECVNKATQLSRIDPVKAAFYINKSLELMSITIDQAYQADFIRKNK